jgi:hypothetical protein
MDLLWYRLWYIIDAWYGTGLVHGMVLMYMVDIHG